MDTQRDLLFGLLAYQKGVIDADCLAETYATWSGNPTAALPEQLVTRALMTVDQRSQLDEVVRRELDAHGGDLQATIAANLDGRTLEVLRDGNLDVHLNLNVNGSGSAPASSIAAGETASYEPSGPVLIGSLAPEDVESRERYTLSSLYAKGGMGQVWLAHDPTLGREIALKELRPDQAGNSTVCTRFLTEARVTAQLEHPGIVPVYEVGDKQLPYYTMRFVRGGTLSQTARRYHKERAAGKADQVEMLRLLSAFVSVCQAMAYAHSKGFIHRDLKGQNVVLGDFGEVIVLDWGLAKRIHAGTAGAPGAEDAGFDDPDEQPEPSRHDATEKTLAPETNGHSNGKTVRAHAHASQAEPELTIRGQILGTPAFMAPEQAAGRLHETDERSDVYGLGAILYELLTGQPPFHARTANELLHKVRYEPPTPPRQINPGVDAALQAICLKALSKAREDRYASALDLAREVQRFLADEPVQAWEEPWARRALRWARKHKTGVAAAAGLLITATVALGISTALISRAWNEATIQARMARNTVDDMYVQVGERLLENELDPLQKEFLAKALDYYERFTGLSANTREVKLEHGKAYQRMAEIQWKFGQAAEAEGSFNKALSMLEPLALADPADAQARRILAATLTRMGDFEFRGNRLDRADALFRRAVDLLKPAVAQDSRGVEDRILLARAFRSQGELMRRHVDLGTAKELASRSADLLEQALAADPGSPELQNDLAQANDFLGRVARDLGDSELYEKAYRRAYDLLDPLIRALPTFPRYRVTMTHICNGLGQYERSAGRVAECETYWRRQLREADRLAQDFPQRLEYQRLLAGAESNVGGILAEQDKFGEAEPILRQGIAVNTALLEGDPADDEVRFDLGSCRYNLGYLQFKREQYDDALGNLDQARQIEEAAPKGESEPQPRYQRMLAMIQRYRGEVLDAQDKAEALDAYRAGADILATLTAKFPENVWYEVEYAQCLNRLADKLVRLDRADEAEGCYKRALAALEPKPGSEPPRQAQLERAMTLGNYGLTRHNAKPGEGEDLLRQSVALAGTLASSTPPASADRRYLALARSNLGEVLKETGRYPEAVASLQAAIDEFKGVIAAAPTLVGPRSYLGNAYNHQGLSLMKLEKPRDAKLAFEEGANQQRAVLKLTGGRGQLAQESLADSLANLAEVDLSLGEYEEARNAAAELARSPLNSPRPKLKAASLLANCLLRLEKDPKVSAGRREDLTRDCLGRAVVMLRQAADLEADLPAVLKEDAALKQLLERPAFRSVFESLVKQ